VVRSTNAQIQLHAHHLTRITQRVEQQGRTDQMTVTKSEWLHRVAHIHAQDAAWFALFCFFIIGVAIWLDMRKDR
jgi:hypothetical protein